MHPQLCVRWDAFAFFFFFFAHKTHDQNLSTQRHNNNNRICVCRYINPPPKKKYSQKTQYTGAKFYPQFESSDFFANELDVVVFAVSILSFEEVLKSIPPKFLEGKLVVDVLSVKMHPKQTMLENLPPSTDIL